MTENKNDIVRMERVGAVLDAASSELSRKQISALPYLANGMSIQKVAALVKAKPKDISGWLEEQGTFQIALTKLVAIISQWHDEQIKLLSMRALEVYWEILEQDYSESSDLDKREISRAAQFIIRSATAEHKTQHVTHELVSPELNISEGTVDILARRVKELQEGETDEIEGEYKLEEVAPIFTCHPDTDYGVINYNEEIKSYQCHICGEWSKDFVQHIEDNHSLTRNEYRELFKIVDKTSKW